MEETHKYGTSTNNLLPLEPNTTTNHGISRVLVKQVTCKSGAPTQDGSKSLSTKESISATSNKPIDALMSTKVKTKRAKKFRYSTDTTEPTRDGRFSILTRKLRPKQRD
jgi:hypothetical protein